MRGSINQNWVQDENKKQRHDKAIQNAKKEAVRVKGMKVTHEPHPASPRCEIIKYHD